MNALKKKYAGLKARLTAVTQKIENANIPEHSVSIFDEQLQEIWKKMCDTHEAMIELSEEDNLDALLAKHCEEESRFLEARMKLANNRESSISGHSQTTSIAEVRLPRLELPTFSGDITEWTTFSDLFTAGVHKNPTLSDAQKMQYLKSAITGEAAALIKHLTITDENYTESWELLKRRFENQRLIANTLTQRLLSLPNVKEGNPLQQLLDQFHEAERSLKAFLPNGDLWELLLLNIISDKLDKETLQAWELTLPNTDIPTLKEFIGFLEIRARAVTIKGDKRGKPVADKPEPRCPECKKPHALRSCPNFEKMDVDRRWDFIRKSNLCRNCLSAGHSTFVCKAGKCKKCQKNHHTLLHKDFKNEVASLIAVKNEILLPTAIVDVTDTNGKVHRLRALLDSGSQVNLLSIETARKMRLKISSAEKTVQTASGACRLPRETILTLKKGDWQHTARCFLSKGLNIILPAQQIMSSWKHIKDIKLADPDFGIPRKIDIILGMGVLSNVLREGVRRGKDHEPIAQNSTIGWLVSGPTLIPTKCPRKCLFSAELSETLKRFWEIEEIPTKEILSEEECTAEAHYQANTTRIGKQYEVKYPFVEEPVPIGNSKDQAVKRFKKLEHLLERKNIKSQYASVIKEYLHLGHLIPVKPGETENSTFYLPHHAVFKNSTTTSLRVVFDASAKTTNGNSLNDVMLNGPKLQEDLFHILIRFQMHAIALCADIEKMYRQILVHPSHQKYQKIIWRDSSKEQLKEFQLTRVTFGMKAAPFLAIKTLHQLADDEKQRFPMAATVVQRDFYVDDLLTGAPTIDAAVELQKELSNLLGAGGFHLRKWCSNKREALAHVVQDKSETELITISADDTIKTLGIHWNPHKDKFSFFVRLPPRNQHTRRTLLSDTAKIFDPMGWLAPVTIQAKVMFQSLWCQSLTWDEDLPEETREAWLRFRDALCDVQTIEVPRAIAIGEPKTVTLCGFCDASQKAYGAVIYLRIEEGTEQKVKLLVAKSKVAPLKILSIPRLELCAAVLLSRLLKETRAALKIDAPAILWTDSEIVLHWIRQPAVKWKTFVANRVTEIQQHSNLNCSWYHVSTKENPADLISRGINPRKLKSCSLWWNGPSWLCHPVLPKRRGAEPTSVPEARKTACTYSTLNNESFMYNYSSLDKLLRITVWIQRFIKGMRKISTTSKFIQVRELRDALKLLIRLTQQEVYSKEIASLRKQQALPAKSSILSLAPFLDTEEILRVGGRLRNSEFPFEKKHQILLPPKHHLTSLILRDLHIKNLHCGPQLLLNTLRQKYWIPKGKTTVQFHTRNCVTCVRQQACRRTQLMGNLPAARVTPGRPFLKCGVDYCGPFICKEISGRGRRTHKAFIAVFVCLVTRAVHLEVVSSLNMDAFMAALNRFIARRGLPSNLYSDNGKNFVAAQRHLKELYAWLTEEANVEELTKALANRNIQWQFIPPYSPHVGGLWEAAVKSLKFHLRRICGPVSFTFEELSTISARIEACLNSRPIHPLSEDVNDLEALTPGHFLIGEPLNSLPEEAIAPSTPLTKLSRYRLQQKIIQDLWKKWRSDYLATLQTRTRWKFTRPSQFKCGDLVIIKDPNSLPQQWKLGRIISLNPGSDGIARFVTIQTSKGPTQRTINNIVKLPTEDVETVHQPFQGGRDVQKSISE